MAYLKAGDTICGQEGWASMIVYDGSSSKVEELFMIKTLEATVEVEKTEIHTLGKRGAQNKPNGWKGSGSMTVYYVSTIFRQMIVKYIKTGVPVYFDITVMNNDPGSGVGSQVVILKNCTLDNTKVAKLDVEAEVLDEDLDFTFDDVDIMDSFAAPVLGG